MASNDDREMDDVIVVVEDRRGWPWVGIPHQQPQAPCRSGREKAHGLTKPVKPRLFSVIHFQGRWILSVVSLCTSDMPLAPHVLVA
jgi:hypothetical protein